MAELVLHVGAHGTDAGRIAAWLAGNRAALEAQGLVLPAPALFLRRLSDALDLGRDEDPQLREAALLAALGARPDRQRVIVSAPGLLGSVRDVLAPEGFYRRDVARRLYGLSVLFPTARPHLLMAIGRATTVLPGLLPDEPGAAEALMAPLTEDTLPWSRVVHTLRRSLPRAPVTVWQHEQLPEVWPDVLHALVGSGVVLPPGGLVDLAASGLGAEARLRLVRYLAGNPPASARQLRDTAAAFGRRFGLAAVHDPARALPGWLRERLGALDRGLATEWDDLSGMAGVRLLGGA